MAMLKSLGYLVLGVSDLDAWEEFATKVVGLQVGAKSDDLLTLRMDEFEQRIVLEKDESDDIISAGWLLENSSELESYVAELREKGVDVEQASDELAAARKVESLYFCQDPNGFQHEFFCGPYIAPATKPFSSALIRNGFITQEFGLGHFVPISKDYEISKKFYLDTLGLKLSGYISPAPEISVMFAHAPNGRFHSLATTQRPFPKKLFHMAVEVADLDDVGLALDRAVNAGVKVTHGIGHHPNAKSVSFYMTTPSGFDFEIVHGEVVVDDDNWQVETYQEFSDWGHHPIG